LPGPRRTREGRLTSRRSTVSCWAVQHRASRPGRAPPGLPPWRALRLARRRERAAAAASGWVGGWTGEEPGHQ